MLYLTNTTFLDGHLQRILNSGEDAGNGTYELRVSREVSERFREAFTERLAKVGFDRVYNLTNEGRMLEELIDRFHG